MWDLDEQIKRVYENPYEKVSEAERMCYVWGEVVHEGQRKE